MDTMFTETDAHYQPTTPIHAPSYVFAILLIVLLPSDRRALRAKRTVWMALAVPAALPTFSPDAHVQEHRP